MRPSRIIKLILVAVVLLPLGLFYIQNAGTRVDLVFRLPGMSWYLAKSAPVPLLLGLFLAVGGLTSALWFGSKAVARGRAVSALNRQIAGLEDDLALARLDQRSRADAEVAHSNSSEDVAEVKSEEATDFDELI
jgi:hypothetical protein